MPTSDDHLSSHNMLPQHHMHSYDSAALSPDHPMAPPTFTCEDNNHTDTGKLQFLPDVCKEESSPDHQESSPSLVQVKLEPPQNKEEQEESSSSLVQVKLEPPHIKEEQSEILLRPEEAAGSPLTFLAVNSEDDDDGKTEPIASTSTEPMKTQADVEDCGTSQPQYVEGQKQSLSKLSKNLNSFKQKTSMRSQTGMKMFCCIECGKVCGQKGALKEHMRSHTGEKPFACAVCNKRFNQRIHLKTHLKTHMRIHTDKKLFTCTVCNQSFSQSQALKSHMKIHTGEKPFACTVCNQSFRKGQALKSHIRVHTGEKPFDCAVCNKRFNQKIHLKTHMRSHTAKKLFTCTGCNQSFSQSQALKSHMNIHTAEKPFACTVCNRRFRKGQALKSHIRVHTGEKPFACTVCNQRFKESQYLEKHMRIHTPQVGFGSMDTLAKLREELDVGVTTTPLPHSQLQCSVVVRPRPEVVVRPRPVVTTKLVSVLVTRFSPNVDTDTLRDYLLEKLDSKTVTCCKIESPDSSFGSFHITAECNNVADMFDPKLWPPGTQVRHYFEACGPNATGSLRDSLRLHTHCE